MIKKIAVWIFDYFKKRNMDTLYITKGEKAWSRLGVNADIKNAMSLVSGGHFRRCLDVGTGLGHYAEIAAGFCDEVVAMDISTEALKYARERLGVMEFRNITFFAGNIRDSTKLLGHYGLFDLIVLGDVLYYLGDERFPEQFKQVIKNIAELSAPNGIIIMSNHVSLGRSEGALRSYVSRFTTYGIHEKQSIVFEKDGKRWLQTVLRKK